MPKLVRNRQFIIGLAVDHLTFDIRKSLRWFGCVDAFSTHTFSPFLSVLSLSLSLSIPGNKGAIDTRRRVQGTKPAKMGPLRTTLICTLGGSLVAVSGVFGLVYVIRELRHRKRLRDARKRWAAVDKDLVILHQLPRPLKCLSLSPYPIKLECFLRMRGVEYVNDFDFPKHVDTQKSPWITLNNQEYFDSQLIVDAISRKWHQESSLSPKEKAVSRSLRVLMEDHLYWVIVIDRYVNEKGLHLHRDFFPASPKLAFEVYRRRAVRKLTGQAYGQGLLRLGKGAVQKQGIEDLEALSTFLGTKTYLMGGDRPSEVDCVLFGFICVIVHTSHEGSVLKTLVEKRLTNLFQHMNRMKLKYFPDWDEIVKH